MTKRYGQWAGNPKGQPYNPKQCAHEVFPRGGSYITYQCSRKPGYGPDKLFCKQHAKKNVKALREMVDGAAGRFGWE
jgi:hypothetical protein